MSLNPFCKRHQYPALHNSYDDKKAEQQRFICRNGAA